MKLLPHQVLKKLAEHERNRAQYELAALSKQRKQLATQRQQCVGDIKQIQIQRNQAISMTVQAATLLMYDELLGEQNRQITQLENKMQQLHAQEQTLLKRWLAHDRRGKTFAHIDEKFIAKAKLALDRHQQRMDDDRTASRLAFQSTNRLAVGA
ncbi:MAG: flagellar FliJ family protein [Mariprofundaceae bacterium]